MATDTTPHRDESEPLVGPGQTPASVTAAVSDAVLARPVGRGWLLGAGASLALVMLLLYAVGYVLVVGVGVWGINVPVSWGFAIVNFVWWFGIAHAGTLLAATLLLVRRDWRAGVNRFAESVALFALACAALFPLLHMGRPWFFYWLLPYPGATGVWPQFRSPLVWDVFALGGYALVSLLFWWVGMLPDLATLRDRATNRVAGTVYAVLAMGWRGDAVHWQRHQAAYVLLAGLAAVITLHAVTSYDFAATILPGWHTAIFPPFFIAGAVLSGLAMILAVLIPVRAAYRFGDVITARHLNNLARGVLIASLAVGYTYAVKHFMNWYGGSRYDVTLTHVRALGPYAGSYWVMIACTVAAPQLLWWPRVRSSPAAVWAVGLVVLVGMWLDRYGLVLASLHHDFLPSSWGPFDSTAWDWATFAGSLGLFLALVFLFVRVLPVVSMSDTREVLLRSGDHGGR